MIEQQLRPGIRLLWNKPPDSMGPLSGAIVASVGVPTPMTYDGLDGHRAIVDPHFLNVNVNTLGLTRGVSNIAYGWFDYAPGRIARLPTAGVDLMSGYMSGCMIIRGTFGGAMSVFHVGTIDGNAVANQAVKGTMARDLPADATGFNPAGAWNPGEVATLQMRLAGSAGAASVFALVTAAGAFYAVLMFPVIESGQWNNPAGRKYWCVGGIKAVPALNRVRVMAKLM